MNIMKVFDINQPKAPGDVWDISHTLSNEYHCNGNDSYYQLEIVTSPDADDDGGGYVTVEELQKLMDWFRVQGAVIGETILVNHWW